MRIVGGEGEPGPVWPDWGDRLRGQRWLAFPIDGGGSVSVRLEEVDGRTVCRGLHIETAEPLATADLRDIPLARLVSAAAQAVADRERQLFPQDPPNPARPTGVPLVAKYGKRPGRKGHPVEYYYDVRAAWYDALRTHPRTPMARTAELIGYSPAQTRRLVDKARELGIIDNKEEQ